MALITRTAKGEKLTIAEMDGNLEYLEDTGINNGVALENLETIVLNNGVALENLETIVLNNGVALENLETIVLNSGGLSGTNYVYVAADGTAVENATALQTAYDLAKTMLPSSTNRITVIASPGNYYFPNYPNVFIMDTEFINLVSLDGNRSILLSGFRINANNVFIKGVDTGTLPINIATNLNLITVENCKGGNYSFVGLNYNPINLSGTFIDCEAGNYSFGYEIGGTTSGTFTNCKAGNYSFGGGSGGSVSGIFNYCNGLENCFGVNCLTSGTFTNCTSTLGGFGAGVFSNASGVFMNCTATTYSFGSTGIASGVFTNCKGGDYSFGGLGTIASGVFTTCISGQQSFGGGINGNDYGTASGVFNYCVAGIYSFGFGSYSTLSGKLYYCRLTSGTFKTVSAGGITRYCLDGSNVANNQG